MRPFATILALFALSAAAGGPARAEEFSRLRAVTRNFTHGRPQRPLPTPDGKAVLFLRSPARSPQLSLYQFDVASGETKELLTPATLVAGWGAGGEEQLSPEEKARRERMRVTGRGFTSFALSDDGATLLLPLGGRVFLVDRATLKAEALPDGAPILDPRLSPDGTKVAYVRDRDLYVYDRAARRERRLTTSAHALVTNGLAEFVAQEEMGRMEGFWWAPDGKALAFEEADARPVETLHLGDALHPERAPVATPYPRAGGANAKVRLGVIAVDKKAPKAAITWIGWDAARLPYLCSVRWDEGAPLTLVVMSRDQRDLELLVSDGKGTTRRLLAEHDDAWLNLDQSAPRWVGKTGKELLWSTERGGGWALELRGADGALVRALTAPADGYRAIVDVDAEARRLRFAGGPEPTEQHLYDVSLDGGGAPARLTDGAAVHAAVIGRDHRTAVVRTTTLDALARSAVFTLDGKGGPPRAVGELPQVAEAAPFPVRAELVRVGAPQYRAALVRPRTFAAGKRYPVVVDVYGGPHHLHVTRDLHRMLGRQWLADHGFIVVAIDGRGTPFRDRAWERHIRGDFARTLDDQVEALVELGRRYPELDLGCVGVYGWSFGGWLSALAALKRPDVFHVAVSGAPVVDWRDYDTFYTERYLGLPDKNGDGYKASSLLSFAGGLRRPLALIHGTSDDNVFFFHTLKLADALLRAGRPVEILALPGLTHMVPDPTISEALDRHLLERFTAVLKP